MASTNEERYIKGTINLRPTADFRVVINQRFVSSKAGISVAWSFLQSGFQTGKEQLARLLPRPETYFCWKVLLR
jgi:hypothetical protein